jgi:prepilin-type N-terminal cleavage/methylation domain-containing protein
MRRPDWHDERGMTLVEMMIGLSVLAIIIGPIMMTFLLGLLESTSTRERVADSSAAQAISSFLLTDVHSSQTVTKGAGCSGSGLVKFSWTDPSTGADASVAYISRSVGGEPTLVRVQCATSNEISLASNVQEFDVQCNPGCSSGSPATPLDVTVDVRAESPDPSNASSYTPFEFAFEASRRVSQ